ncbi:MAG: Polypeptide N-acetylgalactosaminyltransferase 5 [Actinomycetia bacterium]|nr:Polypeptide N-acetylgalactosaminyltransferase 5 [Actinomycetes bacterium]
MPEPVVSIVVVTYNSAAHLEAFAASVADAARDIPYELVVADNASTDGSVDLIRALVPDAIVVQCDENRGYAAGLNAGIAAARGSEAVLVCNPDVRLGGGAVPQLLGALTRTGAGVSAPRITNESGALMYSLRRDQSVRRVLGEAVIGGTRACRFANWSQIVGDEAAYRYPHTVDWASGAVLMLSRACLEAVAPWDESFFMYSEEVDFQLRAREHGFQVWYVPDAVALHTGGDLHASGWLWAMQMRNKVRLFRRRHNPLHTAVYRVSWMFYEAIRAPVGNGIHRQGLRALVGRLEAPRTPVPPSVESESS